MIHWGFSINRNGEVVAVELVPDLPEDPAPFAAAAPLWLALLAELDTAPPPRAVMLAAPAALALASQILRPSPTCPVADPGPDVPW